MIIKRVSFLQKGLALLFSLVEFSLVLPSEMKKRPAQFASCSKQPEVKEESIDYALGYVKTVKEIMLNENKKEKYDEFSKTLKDFKAQKLDVNGTIEKVKELFKGHEDLILGFNIFLPEECQIRLALEDKAEFKDAITFLKKIETRFQGSKNGAYDAFIDILERQKKGNMSLIEVHEVVSILFKDHPDLLVEFTRFVPPPSKIQY